MPGIDLRQATLSFGILATLRNHHGLQFSTCPTAARTEHMGQSHANPSARFLASRRRLRARGVRQSGEVSQFRDAPKKCAAVLTEAHYLARTPKSLARNNKTGCGRSGNGISAAENRATEPTPFGRTNHEPRRRACLGFACLVCCPLRCGDLGATSTN